MPTDRFKAMTAEAEALRASGQWLKALRVWNELLAQGQADLTVWTNVANTLSQVGEYAQALGAYERGLALATNEPELLHGMGGALFQLGEANRAADALRRAAELGNRASTWVSLASMLPGSQAASHAEVLQTRRDMALRLGARPCPRPPRRKATRNRLRIGYLSSFFDRDNYMKPVWGLLGHHDRDAVALELFVDLPIREGLGQVALQASDTLHGVYDLDNDALAELIQSRDLDVLVDLNAYSAPGRVPLLCMPVAHRCAGWFNHFATSGLDGIDALIGDDEVIRGDEEHFYGERIIRLPQSYLTFDVRYSLPDVQARDSKAPFTFGSLVPLYKITPEVRDAWASILTGAPDSRLVLAAPAFGSGENRNYLISQLEARGVDRQRIELFGPSDHARFLEHYARIDLALDAFPYNGGTTTMEALMQGVPVLTFDGDRWASRTSQTLLRHAGLGRFVAHDPTDYVQRAVGYASDQASRTELRSLREELRARVTASPACDTRSFARHMERALGRLVDLELPNG